MAQGIVLCTLEVNLDEAFKPAFVVTLDRRARLLWLPARPETTH